MPWGIYPSRDAALSRKAGRYALLCCSLSRADLCSVPETWPATRGRPLHDRSAADSPMGRVIGLAGVRPLDLFLGSCDRTSFESLVARHRPMGLSVCRGHAAHSERLGGAEPTTFLMLVEEAGSIRDRVVLGGTQYHVTSCGDPR